MDNGLCSPYFRLQIGESQDNPLFFIAADILEIVIQTITDIHGVQIGKEGFNKLLQYADNLTVFVPQNINTKVLKCMGTLWVTSNK